jgi:hypothetical protein
MELTFTVLHASGPGEPDPVVSMVAQHTLPMPLQENPMHIRSSTRLASEASVAASAGALSPPASPGRLTHTLDKHVSPWLHVPLP